MRGRVNFALMFPTIPPFQNYETTYNTTDCNICQDLFCEKIHIIAGIGNLGVREAVKIDLRQFCVGMNYDGGGGVVSGFFNKVVCAV